MRARWLGIAHQPPLLPFLFVLAGPGCGLLVCDVVLACMWHVNCVGSVFGLGEVTATYPCPVCAMDVSTTCSLPSLSLPEITWPDVGHQPTASPTVPVPSVRPSTNLPPVSVTPSNPTVPHVPRVCTENEFACHSHNECVALEYRCDRRPDCRDMSDELDCGERLSGGTVACRRQGKVRLCLGLQVSLGCDVLV